MNFNLTTIISSVAHAVLYVATALLFIIAIFVSAIRWYPSLSDIVEEKIESRLAEILNADIVIESLDISRNQLFSEIIAENVKVIDRQNSNNVWQLKKAKLAISLSKSLFSQSLRIKEVSLQGMDLSLLRDESGDVHINQTFLLPKSKINQENSATKNQYSDVRLALIDSNVHWQDELTQTNYLFEALDISINPTSRGYDVFLSGNLPDVLGRSLQAYLQLEGNLKQLAEAKINFYLKTKQFRFSEIAKRLVGDSGEKVSVEIDSEVWGLYSNKTLSSLRGSIKAENIVEDANSINPELCLGDEYIQQLSMVFDWQDIDRNWQFLASDVEVVSSKRDWPKSDIQFKLKRHSLNGKSIFAHIGSINLGSICNTLHAYSPHIVRFEDQLKDYRFNGNVDDLFVRFDLFDDHRSSYQYSMQFSDVSMWMSQGDRRVSGLSGFVKGNDAGGSALLDSLDVILSVPDQFPGFDLKFATQGELSWLHRGQSHEINTDLLRIYNDDLNLNARMHVGLTGGEIYVDSQIHLDHANAGAVGDYFPLFQKTERTKKWMTDSIHKGDVASASVLLRGNMSNFPFHQSSGVFQTRVNVENGILEYKKGWPVLENVQASVAIDKQRINISSNQAKTLNSKVKKVDVNIDNFLLSVMKLNGTVDGPAQDLLQFLGDASLVRKTNSVLDQISLQGDSRLEVDFSRSLSRKVDHPARVSGNIHFLGNVLDIHKVGIELNDLAGEVAFDQQGATGESVTATVYGQPVKISLRPEGEGASLLNFNGGFDLGEYLTQQYSRFKPYFNGVTNVDGDIYLPSFFKKDNPEKLKLAIHSDMTGIESALPAPLKKDKQTAMDATIKFDQKQGSMSWLIPELIGLNFAIKPQQPFALRMIDLGATQNDAAPDSGLMITGRWQELDPKLWLATYNEYINSIAHSSQPQAKQVPNIHVEVGSLIMPQWPANNIRLLGEQKENHYQIDLDSSLGKGIIEVPNDKNQAVLVNMNSLVLNKSSAELEQSKKESNTIHPSKLRPFSFSSNQLILNEIKLSDVLINASINQNSMVFDEIRLAAQDMNASGTGAWTVQQDQHSTKFNFQLESIDVEDTLVDLGFNSSLKKGEATIQGNIAWPGAPYKFELASMSGLASFDITKGSVSEINPGNAGRLLALLNLGAISRRLSLDFKDVTNKGFTFDSIKGDVELIEGGDLKTEKISIKASAADINIKGTTNLVEQTYDQTIFVTPAVSGTLPAAGAIVGGPVGAAAGILADRVATVVGLNKLSKIEYKMTGTWQEPVIETISKKKANPAANNTGQQSAP